MIKNDIPDPLPPLEWLKVFEAAGRYNNFTAAANELGLTQASVSQRMRNLEAHLGAHLFHRRARGVELTADGEAYLPHVKSALEAMRRGTADLFAAPRTKVSIAAPASVAALWLAPRLAQLRLSHPTLQISVTSIHRPGDFDAAQADLEVRYGKGSLPYENGIQLYQEKLMPSCSPELLRNSKASDWRNLPVIAVSGPRDGWQEWAQIVGEAPLPLPALRFDSFIAAQCAAIAGAGILLASIPLANSAFATKQLVKLTEIPCVIDGGYWLVRRNEQLPRSQSDAICRVFSNQLSD